MDIYRILANHNRLWSAGETVTFFILLMVLLCYEVELLKQKKICVSQAVTAVILFIFLAIVFESTVFSRTLGKRQYQLEILWSWKELIRPKGRLGAVSPGELLEEIILNVMLLFPVGVLLPIIFKRNLSWRIALFTGVLVSACIEMLQLILCRGLFEFDDIIHNGLGCMLGNICMKEILELRKRLDTSKKINKGSHVLETALSRDSAIDNSSDE